jgi:hypothetical protein
LKGSPIPSRRRRSPSATIQAGDLTEWCLCDLRQCDKIRQPHELFLKEKTMPADDPPKVTGQFPDMGIPGQNALHIVVPIFSANDPRNAGGPGGLPGDYEVTFTFHRPGYPLQPEKTVNEASLLEGDSHLEIPSILRFDAVVEAQMFVFEGKRNSRNFLAKIVVKCHADNMKEANDRCYRALMPVLSYYALRWDVPLAIYQIDVKELRKGTIQFTSRNSFQEVMIKGQFAFSLDPEIRTYGAIYREALTTDSITYQFLCFFRLIESMQARRKRLERDATKRGQKYISPTEVYPSNQADATAFLDSIVPVKPAPWDEPTFRAILVPDALGKEFRDIVETQLRPIRDNIAHTLLQRSQELISLDDPLGRAKVELWLPPIKCITRSMLIKDFGALLS